MKKIHITICMFILLAISNHNALAYNSCKLASYSNDSKAARYSDIMNISCLHEKGNPEQKLTLARKYFTGHNVNKNIYLALKLYKEAISENNVEATIELADLYLSNDINDYLNQKNIKEAQRKEKAFILYSIASYYQDSNALKKLEKIKIEFTLKEIDNKIIPVIVTWVNNPEKRRNLYSKI